MKTYNLIMLEVKAGGTVVQGHLKALQLVSGRPKIYESPCLRQSNKSHKTKEKQKGHA